MIEIRPPQSPEEQASLTQDINAFLTRPDVRAALLQFASSVLQPVQPGQSVVGQIGTAIGEAAGAVGRTQQQAEQRAARQRAEQRQERQIGVQESGAAEQARANRAAEQLQQQKLKLEEQRLGQSFEQKRQELELRRQQVANEVGLSEAQRQALLAGIENDRRKLALTEQEFKAGAEAAQAQAQKEQRGFRADIYKEAADEVNSLYEKRLELAVPGGEVPPPPDSTTYQIAYYRRLNAITGEPMPDGVIPDADVVELLMSGQEEAARSLLALMPDAQQRRVIQRLKERTAASAQAQARSAAPAKEVKREESEFVRALRAAVSGVRATAGRKPRSQVVEAIKQVLPRDPESLSEEEKRALFSTPGGRAAATQVWGTAKVRELFKAKVRGRGALTQKRKE